jgi:hypothetical protein
VAVGVGVSAEPVGVEEGVALGAAPRPAGAVVVGEAFGAVAVGPDGADCRRG